MIRQLSRRLNSVRQMSRGNGSGGGEDDNDNVSIGSYISSNNNKRQNRHQRRWSASSNDSFLTNSGGGGSLAPISEPDDGNRQQQQQQQQQRRHHRRNNSSSSSSFCSASHHHHNSSSLSLELDALESKIRERDIEISTLEKQLRTVQQNQVDTIQRELDEAKLQQMRNSILHQLEYRRLEQQTSALQQRLSIVTRDMKDKEAINEYATLIINAAPKQGCVDSAYVMKLQTQLGKAMKKMDGTTSQIALVEQSCEEVVLSLKSEIVEIVDDRCRTELDLKKQLHLLDASKTEMENDYLISIQEKERAIQMLRGKKQQQQQQQKQKQKQKQQQQQKKKKKHKHKKIIGMDGNTEKSNNNDDDSNTDKARLESLRKQLQNARCEREEMERAMRSELRNIQKEMDELARVRSERDLKLKRLSKQKLEYEMKLTTDDYDNSNNDDHGCNEEGEEREVEKNKAFTKKQEDDDDGDDNDEEKKQQREGPSAGMDPVLEGEEEEEEEEDDSEEKEEEEDNNHGKK